MTAQRRVPVQERSRRTVAAIIDAAATVLARDGYDAASTNRIAAAAGVSPGTLYGYFADKDDIVAAVIERVVDGFADGVAPALRDAAGLPVDRAVRVVLDAVLAEIEARGDLIAAFVDHVPAERSAAGVDALRARVSDAAFHLIAAARPAADRAAIERAAWIGVRTVEHLCVRYALVRPAIERAEFVDALTAMVLALVPPAP